jgi:hypothetical protein
MMRASLVLVLVLVLAAALAACGDDLRRPPEPVERSFVVQPGDFAEVNLVMPGGSDVAVRWTTVGGGLDWDIHSHPPDAGLYFYMTGTSAGSRVPFHSPADAIYSYLWQNDTRSAVSLTVAVELGANVTIYSWLP